MKSKTIVISLLTILLFSNMFFILSISKGVVNNEQNLFLVNDSNINEICFVNLVGRGYSMYPTFKSGETITVDKCYSSSDLKKGDVIVFDSSGNRNLVGHRIVMINEEGFITKGDNNDFIDGLIKFDQYVGKVEE